MDVQEILNIILMLGIIGIAAMMGMFWIGYYYWKKEEKMGLHNNPRQFQSWLDQQSDEMMKKLREENKSNRNQN